MLLTLSLYTNLIQGVLLLPWLALIVQILKKPTFPVDDSNLFNRLRLLWFAAARPEYYVNTKGFNWLKNDEAKNMRMK